MPRGNIIIFNSELVNHTYVRILNFNDENDIFHQFILDIEKEEIHLSKTSNITVNDLSAQVPSDEARYHLFIFSHTHEGDHLETVGMSKTIFYIFNKCVYNCKK